MDPRYTFHSATLDNEAFELTEQSVLLENGVDEILRSLPTQFEIVTPSLKQWSKLQFNTRNTIPWKIECEEKGLDREYGIKGFNVELRQDRDLIEALTQYKTSAIGLLLFFTIGTCFCGIFTLFVT